jgi:hypothetical protein
MTVEPFTHLRPVGFGARWLWGPLALGPVGGNHANLHNLNAVPGALAAGLPCRLRLPPGCSCCAGAGAGRDPGAPAAGRAGALVRMLQGGRRFLVPLRQAGGGSAGRVGPAAVQRRCWLVLDFKHTFRREVPVASGRRAVRADPGRMRAGELRVLSAWPQRRRCGRLCRRFRFRENEPGLLRCPGWVRGRPGPVPRIREWEDPHGSAVFRGRRCCSRRRICSGPRRRVMSSKPPQLGSESA